MNLSLSEAQSLCEELVLGMNFNQQENCEVIICPSFPYLAEVVAKTKGSTIKVGAQNLSKQEKGAMTGEVSARMIKDIGADFAIVGHSERRTHFEENDALIREKVDVALANKLKVIYCCGESLEVRTAEEHLDFVGDQIRSSLFHLDSDEMASVIIAYEPIWAIGTGETASPEQANEMHKHIREILVANFGAKTAEETAILYGGSCKPTNAVELFSQEHVDGGLIGGASLKAADFLAIIQAG